MEIKSSNDVQENEAGINAGEPLANKLSKENYEEIRRILATPVVPPKDAKKFFSGKRLEPLLADFADEKVIELDMMANEGQFEDKTLIEYCSLLPEWRAFMLGFYEKTDELYVFFRQRLPGAVKAAFDVTQPFNPGHVYELYGAFSRLVNSIGDTKNIDGMKAPFRSFLQKTMFYTLYARLTYDFIEEVKKLPRIVSIQGRPMNVTHFLQRRYDTIIEHLKGTNAHLWTAGMPGYAEQKSIEGIKINHNKYSTGLAELEKRGATADKESELKKEIFEKYELISDLMIDVDFDTYEFSGENFRIHFANIRKHLAPDERSSWLFKFKVILDPKYKKQVTQKIVQFGKKSALYFDIDTGHFDLIANADNGDIEISTGLSYGLLIEDKAKYLRFKNAVYGLLLDHLLELEIEQNKDTSDDTPVDALVEGTFYAIQKNLNEPEDEIQTDTGAIREDETELQTGRKRNKISLRNRKGARVLAVLKSILGPGIRCEGTSHFIFRSKNGQTYPISIHKGRDVGPGLLHKCLSMYGISREEFDEAY